MAEYQHNKPKKIFSEETRRRMSESAKARCTQEFLDRVRAYWVPFCTAEELRRDYAEAGMSQIEIGSKYGVSLKRVQTSMRRFDIQPRKAAKRKQDGPDNHMWKGANASYTTFHNRVAKRFGSASKCEVCGCDSTGKTYDWANLSGRYEDISDYMQMCRSCHWKYDSKHQNLGAYALRKEVRNAR